MFEQAARYKFRFASDKGLLTAEDLWDLGLTELDKIAINLDSILKQATVSFIKEETNENIWLRMQFNIVRHVIETRLREAKAKVQVEATKVKRAKIKAILQAKKDASLENMSEENLEAMLADL